MWAAVAAAKASIPAGKHHQGVDSDYHNLGNTTLHVYNRNCVRKSMSYIQLYVVGHSRLVTATISMWVVTARLVIVTISFWL